MKTAVELYGEIWGGLSTAIIRAKTTVSVHQYEWQKENAERELKEYERAESALSEAYYRLCDLEWNAQRIAKYARPEPEITESEAVYSALEQAIEAEDFAEADAMNDIAVLTCGDAE
jgi:hypothetical protein